MDNLELKICCDELSLAKAYSLRYRSYLSVSAIDTSPNESFSDEFDSYPNSHTFILNKGENTVASIRACVGKFNNGTLGNLPSNIIYPDDLSEFLEQHADAVVVESSRFVTAPEYDQKAMFKFVGVFLGIALCAEHYDCTHIVTAVREDQSSFYSKYFNLKKISEEKQYLGLNSMMILTGSNKSNFDFSRLKRSKISIDIDHEKITSCFNSKS